jgi:hypothetical protein
VAVAPGDTGGAGERHDDDEKDRDLLGPGEGLPLK